MSKPTTSHKLEELLRQQKKIAQAIDRCSLAIKSLEAYLGTLNVKDVGVAEVKNIVKAYQTIGQGLDDEITGLREEAQKVELEITMERERLAGPAENQFLRKKASVGVFADCDGEVEIRLLYGAFTPVCRLKTEPPLFRCVSIILGSSV